MSTWRDYLEPERKPRPGQRGYYSGGPTDLDTHYEEEESYAQPSRGLAPPGDLSSTRSRSCSPHGGRSSADLSQSQVTVQDFKEIKVIGQGAFGKVSLVVCKKDGQSYALKKIVRKEEMDRYLRTEINVMQACSHPNIVKLYNYFEAPDFSKVYMVLEYCEGGDLSQLLKAQNGRLIGEVTIISWFGQIVSAIAYLHGKKVIHRDLKPGNVLVKSESLLKVADLGVSRIVGKSGLAQTCVGTPAFMAPEVSNSPTDSYTFSSDVWSLGCILTEMATLQQCFANTNNYARAQHQPIHKNYRLVPQLVTSCIQLEPRNRAGTGQILRLTSSFLRNKC